MADRLDLFEQGQVQTASTHLTIHLQGIPTIAGQHATPLPALGQHVPTMLVTSPEQSPPTAAPASHRLSSVALPEYAKPTLSEFQRERLKLVDIFESADNLVVADYAKLAGKSRRWITYEIQAGNLLAIQLGNKGQRVPVWQLEPLKRQLVQTVLRQTPRGVDTWDIYHALHRPDEALGGRSFLDAVTQQNMKEIASLLVVQCARSDASLPANDHRPRQYEG